MALDSRFILAMERHYRWSSIALRAARRGRRRRTRKWLKFSISARSQQQSNQIFLRSSASRIRFREKRSHKAPPLITFTIGWSCALLLLWIFFASFASLLVSCRLFRLFIPFAQRRYAIARPPFLSFHAYTWSGLDRVCASEALGGGCRVLSRSLGSLWGSGWKNKAIRWLNVLFLFFFACSNDRWSAS